MALLYKVINSFGVTGSLPDINDLQMDISSEFTAVPSGKTQSEVMVINKSRVS